MKGKRWRIRRWRISDGGPTMTARTDQIRSVREAEESPLVAIDAGLGDHKSGEKTLAACGHLAEFRAAYGWMDRREGGVAIDPASAALLRLGEGDMITHVPRW